MAEFLFLKVSGMKCGGCETNLKTKLGAMNGVLTVVARHKENRVELEYEPKKVTPAAIIEAITASGFKVEQPEDDEE